ncbi:MAG TPA: ABC transporter substrate-binding protein [Anaeromyxobacter sp.]|nr:ABC transporter substrate-binding protein [Anaeromyxobacter sp.]
MRFLRVVAAAALVLAIGCSKKESSEILIGHVASLTGSEATFGQSTDNGIKLAFEELNKAGGVKGKKLVLKTLDDQGKPEEAQVAATRLIVNDKVTLIIGEVASSRSLAMGPVAEKNKVPMISTASTNPKVTLDQQGNTLKYVFRVCFIDPFQGTVMAKFARENMKISKVAVLRDVGNAYSVGLADFFEDTFKKMGGEIVTDQSFKAGDQDFKAQLTKIRETNPEAIYVPAYYTDVGLISRQVRELGMKVPLMGGDGWDSEELYKISQGALNGSFFSNHYTTESPDERVKSFIEKYKAAYGSVPDALAALGYDAALVAADAMNRAKDLSGPAIADALAATKDFKAVTGNITLNEQHNAVKSAVVIAIDNNAGKYAATVSP